MTMKESPNIHTHTHAHAHMHTPTHLASQLHVAIFPFLFSKRHEYESHAKCAGAAADVTVVVRGRVVDDDVVDVNGVEGASVVVVAAAPPASSAPRARHCRGRFRRDIGRKNAAQADTGHVEGCCPWRRIHRRSSSSSGSRSHVGVAFAGVASSQKWRPPVTFKIRASKHKTPCSHQPRAKEKHSLRFAFFHRRQQHIRTNAAAATTTDWKKHVAVPSHQCTQEESTARGVRHEAAQTILGW